MSDEINIAEQIISSVEDTNQYKIVQPIRIGHPGRQNELLLFIKPEIFLVSDRQFAKKAVSLMLQKCAEFKVVIDGVMILGGDILAQKEIMNHHYGYINKLSRFASQILTEEDRKVISDKLGIAVISDYKILGGHEFLKTYPDDSLETLDQLWFTKKSIKLRSGFYIQAYDKGKDKIILVNGFHPSQLHYFTAPDHRIVLFLLHSDTAWKALKNEMVGATYPEKAVPNSIRGALYSDTGRYGLKSVTIATNGVHLSAGPFEAMFEIVNFMGEILNLELKKTPPLLVKHMMSCGVDFNESVSVLKNPNVKVGEREVDLFTATEDMDTGQAVKFWLDNKRIGGSEARPGE